MVMHMKVHFVVTVPRTKSNIDFGIILEVHNAHRWVLYCGSILNDKYEVIVLFELSSRVEWHQSWDARDILIKWHVHLTIRTSIFSAQIANRFAEHTLQMKREYACQIVNWRIRQTRARQKKLNYSNLHY